MKTLTLIGASIFSPAQLTVTITLAVVLAALIAANVAVAFIFARRGVHRLQDSSLQARREELMARLEYIKAGGEVEARTYPLWEIAAGLQAGGQLVPPEVAVAAAASVDDEEDDESEPLGVEILAVADMAPGTRESLGFMGEEYDDKRYYVRYSYGFEAKLRNSDAETKNFYVDFVNELSAYKGVKIKGSFRGQRVYKGRKTLAMLLFRGKKLCVAFALNPADYAETKYHGEDMSAIKRFEKTPMLMRFTSSRKFEYAKYLFEKLAEADAATKGEVVAKEYDLEEQSRDDMYLAGNLRIIVLGEVPEGVDVPRPEAVIVVEDEETDEGITVADEEFETIDDVTVAFDSDITFTVDEDGDELEEMLTPEGTVVRYNRSFSARVIQSNDDLKARYSELKNYLLAYKGVTSRTSWRRESFRVGKSNAACFTVRGKTLCLFLASDPKKYENTKYKVEDLSLKSKNAKLPLMFKLKSDRRMGYAKELIDAMMAERGIKKLSDYKAADFKPVYKSTEVLVRRDLIRIVGDALPNFEAEEAEAAAKGIHYNRSFTARIIQSDDLLKSRYSELKNHLLSYSDAKVRNTWKRETYRVGKNNVASIAVRGKTLCLYLAADPSVYSDTKYRGEDLSQKNPSNKFPLLYRIKSDRKMGYAKHIIDGLMKEFGAEKTDREPEDYAVPYKSTDALVRKGLIRVVQGEPYAPSVQKDKAPAKKKAKKKAEEFKEGESAAMVIPQEQIDEAAAQVAAALAETGESEERKLADVGEVENTDKEN